GRQHMQYIVAIGLDTVDDACFAAFPAQQTGVAGLAATQRIEDGTIEAQAALLECGDGGVGLLEIGVLPEKFFDHGRGFRRSTDAPQRPCAAASKAPRPTARRNRRRLHWRSGRLRSRPPRPTV